MRFLIDEEDISTPYSGMVMSRLSPWSCCHRIALVWLTGRQIDLSDQRRPADGLDRELNPPSTRFGKGDHTALRARTIFELTREANAFKQAIETRGGL